MEEMTSPPSPKRPRPDHTVENNGERRLDFPPLLAFPKPVSLQQNTIQTCSDNLPLQTTNIHAQQSIDHFDIDLAMHVQAPKVSITDITETDRLILNMLYDSDGAVTVSHDCSPLGKSLQCEPPVEFSAAREDRYEGRQVQNSSTHIQIVTLDGAEEDVRCQADCSYEEAPHDECSDIQNGALATAEVSNQKEIQCEFCKKSLCNKKSEQVKNDLSLSHFADGKSFGTKPEVCPSSSLAEVEECNGETSELQNVASSASVGKTEGQFSEGKKQSFAAAGELTENMNMFYAKDECKTKKEESMEDFNTKVGIETACDTTETQALVSISQVITEGDNDGAPFRVIDSVKWSGAGKPSEERRNAGFELSASEKVYSVEENLMLETRVLQGETVKLSRHDQTGQSLKQQLCEYKKDCQSHMEAVTSIAHDKTCDKSDTENHWRPTSHCSSRSAIFDSSEDQRGGSQGTVGAELKEKNQSGSCSSSLDHPEAHKVEDPQEDMAKMDETSKKDMIGVVSINGENGLGLEEVVLLQNLYKDTIGSPKWMNESDCSSKFNAGMDLAGFADNKYIACKVVEMNTYKENAVEGRDSEQKINGQETTSVASEEQKTNIADIQLTFLSKLQEKTNEMMDSDENKSPEEPSEQAKSEIVLEQEKVNLAERNRITCSALTVKIVGSQGEKSSKVDTVHEKLPQHANLDIQLPSEQAFCSTPEPAIEEEMIENTLNVKRCAAKSSNNFSVELSNSNYAVILGINSFGAYSHHTDSGSSALHNCNGRFSTAPSACTFTMRVPDEDFDTFEKIQLSLDDYDMDLSTLGNDALLAGPSRQLLEYPQQHFYHSKFHATIHETEKSEEIELSSANENGSLNNHDTCNEVPSPILAADVLARGWPELKAHCESAFQIYDCFQDDSNLNSSAVSFESDFSDCEDRDRCKLEIKTQFDTVLRELKMFFDISASDMASSNGTSSPEQQRELTEALEGGASKYKDQEEGPHEPYAGETIVGNPDEDGSLECEGGAGGCGAKIREGEQEVPIGSCELQEAPTRNQLNGAEARETEQRQRMWSPSFMSQPLVEQLTQKLLEPQRRLEPLRTCTRPIRVGLSKRATTSHLHNLHQYK